jgi:hypothetical protein
MRKTNIWAALLGAAAVVTFGCYRAARPMNRPDAQGNAAPIKDVATVAHAREIPLLEPYDAVNHLYRNAKSSLPTSVRLAILDTADWVAIWKRIVGNSSPALVIGDVVVVGPAHEVGMRPPSQRNFKGDVRGFDVRTGKLLWTFHTIPEAGELGYDTWLDGSAERTGNAGVWAAMTADAELGYIYLPT